MDVAITGRPRAIASMITTGSPSAKLGSTSARAASSSRRTPRLSRKPVIRTRSRRPGRSIGRSSSPRIGPSPTMTSSKSRPRSRSRAAASTSRSWPFCSASRPTLTSRGRSGTGVAGRRQEDPVEAAADHVDLRPVAGRAPAAELAAGEVADGDDEVRRGGPSRPGQSGPGASNSSGPWIVRLYGGPAEAAGRASRRPPRWCRSGRAGAGRRPRPAVGGAGHASAR